SRTQTRAGFTIDFWRRQRDWELEHGEFGQLLGRRLQVEARSEWSGRRGFVSPFSHTLMQGIVATGTKFGHGVDGIKEWILPKLPLGTAYYPKFGATNPLDNKDKSGAKSSFSPSSMTKK
ncbi:hypothetical protein ACJX0J_009998, partial [Zea mays]